MTFKRFSHQLHLWGGLGFGVHIFLLCLTGAVLLFEPELREASTADLLHCPPPTAEAVPLSPAQLMDKASGALRSGEEWRSFVLEAQTDRAIVFTTTEGRDARLVVDRYTGQVRGRLGKSRFFDTVRELHRALLIRPSLTGRSWGQVLVAASTLFFALLLLSGLVIWMPKRLKGLRKRMKIHTNRGLHRFSSDLHQTGGVVAAVVLLVLCLTGLTWSFPSVTDGVLKLSGLRTASPPLPSPLSAVYPADTITDFSPRAWDVALAELKEQERLQGRSYVRCEADRSQLRAYLGDWGNAYAADVYEFQPHSGRLCSLLRYEDSSAEQRFRAWIYALHTASWGSWATKLITLLALLLGMALPLSGYHLWWKRRQKRMAKRAKTAARQA